MSAGVRLGLVHRVGGGARTNLNTKPGVPFCMQVTLASLVSQHNTTSLPTGYSDEWELRTLNTVRQGHSIVHVVFTIFSGLNLFSLYTNIIIFVILPVCIMYISHDIVCIL